MKASVALLYTWAGVYVCVGVHGGLFTRDLDRPDRIVGGEPVEKGAIPWQVSLQFGSHHFCGGTLVSPNLVLTAAHCTIDFDMEDVTVVTGAWDINDLKEHRYHRVVNVTAGPYEVTTMENDIALLWIEEETRTAALEDLPRGLPINIETRKEANSGNRCIISGWGRVSSGGSLPNVLMAADVQIREDEECQDAFTVHSFYKVYPSNLCAGGGAKDACQGDSGGPLVCCNSTADNASCRLVGITSWGIGCATKGLPGVYTEVAHFIDWIKESVQQRDNGRALDSLKFYP